ncbi:DUF4406 domain-containing protein [Aerococcaceae bacterium NML191219]|nr:DUF4406 domain-containing protein [Aerococcaceae bacterium NML191219]
MAFKPLVYICAPFSGDVETNKTKATKYAEFAYRNGAIPVTPHLLFPFLDDSNEADRQSALFMDIILLGKCQEVWVFGDNMTDGMKAELEVSNRRKQPIRYFTKECEEVAVCS